MMKTYVACLVLISSLTVSCRKDDSDDQEAIQNIHNIYIGGMDNGPVYWKNGVRVALPYDTSGAAASSVNCMYVDGYDVYAAGRHVLQPAYWKNGNLILLPYNGNYANVTGITLLNGDVYISGYDSFTIGGLSAKAVYWKNGVRYELQDSLNSMTTDMLVDGNDLYIVGTDYMMGAVCWKNRIPASYSAQNGAATAIFMNVTDQYITGDGQIYWKNGILHSISNVTPSAYINEGFANGTDLFFCGHENNLPFLWKNGTKINLPIDPGLTHGSATEISVLNNDLYVAGGESDGFTPIVSRAIYWKNGMRNLLPAVSDISSANCIFIK